MQVNQFKYDWPSNGTEQDLWMLSLRVASRGALHLCRSGTPVLVFWLNSANNADASKSPLYAKTEQQLRLSLVARVCVGKGRDANAAMASMLEVHKTHANKQAFDGKQEWRW